MYEISKFCIFGCLHLLVTVNSSAINVGAKFFCFKTIFQFSGEYRSIRSGIAESYGNSSLVAQTVKNLPAMRETSVQFLDQEDPLEKEVAAYCCILAWRIPWTEETSRLQSKESDVTEQLTMLHLPGNSMLYLLRNSQIIFHSGYTISHTHQHCRSVYFLHNIDSAYFLLFC